MACKRSAVRSRVAPPSTSFSSGQVAPKHGVVIHWRQGRPVMATRVFTVLRADKSEYCVATYYKTSGFKAAAPSLQRMAAEFVTRDRGTYHFLGV